MNLIESIQKLTSHAKINPLSPGSFNDLLRFYEKNPNGTEQDFTMLNEAIVVLLEAPMPNVTVSGFLSLSVVTFVFLNEVEEIDKEMYFAAKNN